MNLYLDTADKEKVTIGLMKGSKFLLKKEFLAPKSQAEKLLPAIEALLKKQKIKLKDLKKIVVNNQGGSFTSLRIGVVTANALANFLDLSLEAWPKSKNSIKGKGKIKIVLPLYSSEPNIVIKKNKI